MLSTGLISLFFALGASGWAYSQMNRRVGAANAQSVYVIVAITFVVAYIFMFTLFKYVLHFS